MSLLTPLILILPILSQAKFNHYSTRSHSGKHFLNSTSPMNPYGKGITDPTNMYNPINPLSPFHPRFSHKNKPDSIINIEKKVMDDFFKDDDFRDSFHEIQNIFKKLKDDNIIKDEVDYRNLILLLNRLDENRYSEEFSIWRDKGDLYSIVKIIVSYVKKSNLVLNDRVNEVFSRIVNKYNYINDNRQLIIDYSILYEVLYNIKNKTINISDVKSVEPQELVDPNVNKNTKKINPVDKTQSIYNIKSIDNNSIDPPDWYKETIVILLLLCPILFIATMIHVNRR